MLQRSVGWSSAAEKWWQAKLTEQNFLDCSTAKEMVSWYSLSAFVEQRTKITAYASTHTVTHPKRIFFFKMWRHCKTNPSTLYVLGWRDSCTASSISSNPLHQVTSAPYRPVYYAWPVGEMTRDILLTQQDVHILTAVSKTGGEMSLSVLAQPLTARLVCACLCVSVWESSVVSFDFFF